MSRSRFTPVQKSPQQTTPIHCKRANGAVCFDDGNLPRVSPLDVCGSSRIDTSVEVSCADVIGRAQAPPPTHKPAWRACPFRHLHDGLPPMARHGKDPVVQSKDHHRSAHRSRRHRDERSTSVKPSAENPPDLDELRRERVEFYSRSPEEQRRRESSSKARHGSSKVSDTVKTSNPAKERRHRKERHKRREEGSRRPRTQLVGKDDDGVYVYRRDPVNKDAARTAIEAESSNGGTHSHRQARQESASPPTRARQIHPRSEREAVAVEDSEDSVSDSASAKRSSKSTPSRTSVPVATEQDHNRQRTPPRQQRSPRQQESPRLSR